MNRQSTETEIEVVSNPYGIGLAIRTPGRYAMDVAVEILTYLDKQPGVNVKNTGWKNGFGLEVAVWLPIVRTENVIAEITTDGEDFHLRRASGPYEEFAALVTSVVEFLDSRKA
jgi:hypothetical protein